MQTKNKKQESRSPLKSAPLRYPGQSLDEEISRRRESALDAAMLASVLIVLAALEWVRWWQDLKPNPLVYTIAALIALAYLVWRIILWRRQFRMLKLARDGERAVGQFLEELRIKGYQVLHDLVGDGFNLDHVLIGPAGVFTIETKTHRKPTSGRPKIVYDGKTILIAGHKPDRDPIIQAKAQAYWLKTLLRDSTGREFFVQPIVVYPGWFVVITAKPDAVLVMNPKALPKFLAKCSTSLSTEDAHLAAYHVRRWMRAEAEG